MFSIENIYKNWDDFIKKSGYEDINRIINQNLISKETPKVYKRFRSGLEALEIKDIKQGFFAYHGTSQIAAMDIMKNGFNSEKRVNEIYGKGDYFAEKYSSAKTYSKAPTPKEFYVLVVYIIDDPRVLKKQNLGKKYGHYYILHNDSVNGDLYCLPIELLYYKGSKLNW